MLTILNYKKDYGSGTILEIDNQKFAEGCHMLQGHNGSGKTTLFKSIAGLLQFEGQIMLDPSINMKKQPLSYRYYVNYCEAEPTFPGYLTAMDLARFVAKAKKAETKQVSHLVEMLNMGDFFRNPVDTYSSGMLKKTSLLLGFLGSPKVILLDEPFTTIDLNSQSMLIELITTHRYKCVFLISSHQSLDQIPMSFDAVYQINHKQLVQR